MTEYEASAWSVKRTNSQLAKRLLTTLVRDTIYSALYRLGTGEGDAASVYTYTGTL